MYLVRLYRFELDERMNGSLQKKMNQVGCENYMIIVVLRTRKRGGRAGKGGEGGCGGQGERYGRPPGVIGG